MLGRVAAWVAAVAVAAVVWLLMSARPDRAGREPQDRRDVATPAESARDAAGATAQGERAWGSVIGMLREASLGDRARLPAAAAALRRLLRMDEEARRRAEGLLLDAETPREVRMVLAFVLGTLPGGVSDAALLQALDRFAADAEFVRCTLLALGATREPPEDDDIFEMGDRPWGQPGPEGLGITVKRSIDDPRVRKALALHLERSEAAVREAAALSLRHTLHEGEVRDVFLAALGTESSDAVASELGEALAAWAGTASRAERTAVVERLLARAAEAGFDAYRFRMEDDFRRIALSAAERARLDDYADAGRPLEVRVFALGVLAGSAARSGDEAVASVRATLMHHLTGDRDDAVRDHAARLLGSLPDDPAALETLAAAARNDTAWNVRYAAVDSLGRFLARPGVREALETATNDDDPRVAARARKLLER